MPRKLKVYQTSIGFFDLVVAVPSMKAALEIWGADSNLFHQEFARAVTDPKTVSVALDNPGIVLKRPVGTNEALAIDAHLPKNVLARRVAKHRANATKTGKRRSSKDRTSSKKASAAYERDRKKPEAAERREEAKRAKDRERRDAAVRKAMEALKDASDEHDDKVRQFQEERTDLAGREKTENLEWDKKRWRLQAAVKKARS